MCSTNRKERISNIDRRDKPPFPLNVNRIHIKLMREQCDFAIYYKRKALTLPFSDFYEFKAI